MSVSTKQPVAEQRLLNVPNQLTALRLLLSLVLFVLIALEYYLASAVVFVVAAGTDWLDGYWARKYGQVTNLGRILDPFVDKIIVCGTFIFLAAVPDNRSGIQAWMAVAIVGRELLVTALRSYLEGEGADFSAVMSGKLKMVVQCVAAAISLYALSLGSVEDRPPALAWALAISVWAAVLLTVYSGAAYVRRAVILLGGKKGPALAHGGPQRLAGAIAMDQHNPPALSAILVGLAAASLVVWASILDGRRRGLPLAPYETRKGVPWSGLDLLTLGLLALFLEQAAGVFAKEAGAPAPGTISLVSIAALAGSHLVWMACALVYLNVKAGAQPDDLGLDAGKLGADMRLAARLFLAALVPVYGTFIVLTAGLGWESKHPLAEVALEHPSFNVLVLATLLAVVAAPLAEEFFFRVLLQGWLERLDARRQRPAAEQDAPDAVTLKPSVLPMIGSALFFALLHAGHGPDPIPLFVLGLFLGYAYRQTHRIAAPLAIHVLVNALTMLQLWVVFLAGD